jgi:hypothetical protein
VPLEYLETSNAMHFCPMIFAHESTMRAMRMDKSSERSIRFRQAAWWFALRHVALQRLSAQLQHV